MAADKRHIDAMYNYGIALLNRGGVTPNKKEFEKKKQLQKDILTHFVH